MKIYLFSCLYTFPEEEKVEERKKTKQHEKSCDQFGFDS